MESNTSPIYMNSKQHPDSRYIVCGSRPWNRRAFDDLAQSIEGKWEFVSAPDELAKIIDRTGHMGEVAAIFFLHWSWRIPESIYGRHPCVLFHMTDLPFGRGGSPLQNLLARGLTQTVLSAIAVVEEVDAGPVYAKEVLILEGTAEAIYMRADRLAVEMIKDLISNPRAPVAQLGVPEPFARRVPSMSELPEDLTDLDSVHDFIRMLDASGYPYAYIDYGGLRIHLSRSARYHQGVRVDGWIELRGAES